MKSELEKIDKKITALEESYEKINSAWLSGNEVKTRIESLIIIARELRAVEEKENKINGIR